tara:strand:- start:91 stop:915 length:825 start_codon:yes stop_codon:yes gene_type:complete
MINPRKNVIVKKSLKIFYDFYRNLIGTENNKAIFLNSIPKSGTHLAHQLLIKLNFNDRYGFFASTPSRSMEIQESYKAKKYFRNQLKNELISGHLFYSKEMECFFEELSIPTVFIYRDPRAIFLSELNYLSNMNRWHRSHKYYASCNSFNEKFNLCLEGLPESSFYYPKFSQRIKDYLGWINSNSVYAIRFENLINEDIRVNEINNLLNYLETFDNMIGLKISNTKDLKTFLSPENSHTFSGLEPDRWKTVLSSSQINQLESHLGALIKDMGYI